MRERITGEYQEQYEDRLGQFLDRLDPSLRHDWEVGMNETMQMVRTGTTVVVEGNPLYTHQTWCNEEHAHEFSYNWVIPTLIHELRTRKRCRVGQVVLLDDHNLSEEYEHLKGEPDTTLVRYMTEKPDRIVFESDLIDEAGEEIRTLSGRRTLIQKDGKPHLSVQGKSSPLLNGDGDPSCEILDAMFQMSKAGLSNGCDTTIIVHPTDFKKQQEGMRSILRAVNDGRLPFDVINIFYKEKSLGLSTVHYTDHNGNTERIA